jgi:hypothetical protein
MSAKILKQNVLIWILLTESMLIISTRLGAFLHEFVGHGLAALLFGGRFEAFSLTLFAGGEARFSGDFSAIALHSHKFGDRIGIARVCQKASIIVSLDTFRDDLCRDKCFEPVAVPDSRILLPPRRSDVSDPVSCSLVVGLGWGIVSPCLLHVVSHAPFLSFAGQLFPRVNFIHQGSCFVVDSRNPDCSLRGHVPLLKKAARFYGLYSGG